MLLHQSLVMIDEETLSLWSHILGESTDGPLEGSELELIPSVLTDWESWLQSHPETTVCMMSRTAEHHRRLNGPLSEQLCIGLSEDDQTRCWTFPLMARRRVINDKIGDRPVLVVFDNEHGAALLFDRRFKRQLLTFEEQDGALVDRETGSEWDRMLGVAVSGEMEGNRLQQLPGIVSYLERWQGFHPDGETIDEDD